MRANHFVTFGLCFGVVGVGAAVASCGTDTSGTCTDTNSCGPGSEGGADNEMPDVNLGDTQGDTEPTDGGGDVKSDGPGDGSAMCEAGMHDCNGKCVDEGNDPNNCGMCGHVCPAPDSGMGTATCSGTPPTCGFGCATGYHLCNGQCLSDGDDPSSDPCVLTQQYGVFVATPANGGSDTGGNGTPAKPYATISHAIANLNGTKRVYVCDGAYSDQVAVTGAVSIYGALTCAGGTWAYAAGTTADVTSPSATGAPALTVSNVSGTVLIEDITFTSQNATGQDASGNGNSSIAALVSASTVNMMRVGLTAGTGTSGNDGANGDITPNYSGTSAPSGAPGQAAGGDAGNGGGPGGVASCQSYGASQGGTGGAAGGGGAPGGNGGPGTWTPIGTTNPPFDGLGGNGNLGTCTPGHGGANGAAQGAGAAATSIGSLTAVGWVPTAGTDALSGDPGEGGGGGGGNSAPALGGDGGGAGGCGGKGGAGGAGGGGSIALASFNATVTLTGCTIRTSAGGNGGKGGSGEAGEGGGAPGGGVGTCTGGFGGNGAGGSGGGGGTAGISVGILWSGTQPMTPSTNIMTGAAGLPGARGVGGAAGSNTLGMGNPGNTPSSDGNPGTSTQILQAP